MTHSIAEPGRWARIAGVLYLAIIILGIGAEAGIRGILIDPSDAASTAASIRGATGLFKLGIAADAIMAVCDIALAVLLFMLLRPAGPLLALMAMVFRLVQASIIAANLMNMHSALMILTGSWPVPGAENAAELLAMNHLTAHAHGYDLGLVFFAFNSLLTGWLLIRCGFFPKTLGWGLVAAGGVYLTGSSLRFLTAGMYESFQPAYLICLLAELAFALWLLVRGVNVPAWHAAHEGQANQAR